MKWLLIVVISILASPSFTQNKRVDFSTIDARAEIIDSNSPDTLAHLLTNPYTAELEKVRSIFYWVASHISYNTIRYQPKPINYIDDGVAASYDLDTIYKTLDLRVSEMTLKRRHAFCDGYARLFKTLCDKAGIKSVVISGYARTGFNTKQFHCNHKWNAVMIDGNWYLLDATWASGYLSFSGNNFIHDFNENYFLTPPQYFIKDHYPAEIRWTLLPNPPTLSEFNHSPFKQPAFNYKILAYYPAKGVINAAVGDTITIGLQTTGEIKNLLLIDKASVDSADIALADSASIANNSFCIKDGKVNADYIVSNDEVQWLQVIYNGECVLRYRLNIKKQPFPFPPVFIKDIASTK